MARDPSHVVMLGTSFETRGGIAAVLDTYRRAGLFDRWPVDFLATHRDGTWREKASLGLAALAAFVAMLLRHPRAVLHVHSASRASFWRKSVFMALAMAMRWPVIFHLHGGGFATFYDAECGPLRRAFVRFFLDRAACIVVVSERWCAWMHRATRNPRIVTLANPVPAPRANVPREEALVAFVGGANPDKGGMAVLEAIARLVPRHRELRIEWAGDGETEGLRAAAQRLGIAERITFLGWIDRARREELFARAACFVLPSHAEGLPVSMLEAMAAGCPVVASDVGGIPDVIVDGYNGWLVAPRDAAMLADRMHRILADPALALEMGRAARTTIASRFSPERTVQRLGRLYAQLGVRPGPAPARQAPTPSLHRLKESP